MIRLCLVLAVAVLAACGADGDPESRRPGNSLSATESIGEGGSY